MLDKSVPRVTDKYGAIYENFEKDIYISLERLLPLLSKYNTINIILPQHNFYHIGITTGLCEFCQEYTFEYKFVHYISNEFIKKGKVYFSLMEYDLVDLIGKILDQNLVLGKDVGAISYNEISIKKIIMKGITTISTDFKMMGERQENLEKIKVEILIHMLSYTANKCI